MGIYTEAVQKLYVAYFSRPADAAGLTYWEGVVARANGNTSAVSAAFAASQEYKDSFAGQSEYQVVNTIYMNLFGRTAEPEALTFWGQGLINKSFTIDQAVTTIANAAQGTDATAYANKVAAATAFSTALNTSAEIIGYSGNAANGAAKAWLGSVTTNESLTAAIAPAALDKTVTDVIGTGSIGQQFVLTNGTDVGTANTFTAGLVYNPAGTDRINSLQSEDTLTGASSSTTNVLNATLGNANDNGSATITPTLKNIQTINLDVTGNTNVLDVRFADSLQSLNINKLTAEATNTMTINNIGQVAANLSVKNSAAVDGTVNFNYINGVLAAQNAAGTAAGGNVGNVNVENVALAALNIGNAARTEGFETINLTVSGTNSIRNLQAVDAEVVKIVGTGDLTLANNIQSATGESTVVNPGGITIGNGVGIRSINATDLSGDLNINVSAALGGHSDPGNSGSRFFTEIKLGSGDDTIWTTSNVAAGSATLFDNIDGGAGTDTLRTFSAGVARGAKVTNVEALELRGAGSSAYISSFDAALNSVLVRNEFGGAQSFALNNVTKALAEGGNIVLRHAITGANGDTVDVRLADASAAADTAVVTVQNDLNTGTLYNYTINAQSQLRADVAAGTATATTAQLNATRVENVTINDNDTETNIVTLTRAADHTGTVKLTGGTAGLDYTVASTLTAATVDAATQLSNLRLSVGTANQAINLGAGSDILTFAALDSFNGSDTITDAGGIDTVRAAFSTNVAGTPALTGIEKLHIVATENISMDMSKATTVSELAILSDKAVDGDADNSPLTAEPFAIAAGQVSINDVITLKNTSLSTLNFFGDNESVDPVAPAPATGSLAQIFNGVTLENNTGDALAVSINSSLDAGIGAASYALGQLTVHGVKTMSVVVGNELAIPAGATASATTTTINNVYGKNLQSFTATANGALNLGTVSGSGLANTMTTFDTTAVKGALNANVIILGDNAQVKLGNGVNTFNAIGSAGKGVTITSGSASDFITGTAQSDTIIGGAGNDVINADRGDNVVDGGAGDETVTAGDGNNTISFGTGHFETVLINDDSGNDATKANNSFALSGTMARIQIDVNGVGAQEVDLYVGVGAGSDLTLNYSGATLNASTAVLDGRLAVVDNLLTTGIATANSDLFIDTAGGASITLMNGGAGNDVLMGLNAAVNYTLNGGLGNDGLVAVGGTDTLTGGAGADRLSINEAVAATDTIVIADGESLASGWDMVTGFSTAAVNGDVLDLSSTVVGTTANLTATAVTSTASGAIVTAGTIATGGIVTFGLTNVTGTAGTETTARVSSGADLDVTDGVGVISLAQALSFLAQQLNNTGATVAFTYDYDGNGIIDGLDSTIVFQDGATDTVVELIGVVGVVAVAGVAGANTIVVI